DPPQALHRGLVVQMAHQRIAGIGGQGDDAAGMNDLRGLLDQPRLRVLGMYLKKLTHDLNASIVMRNENGGSRTTAAAMRWVDLLPTQCRDPHFDRRMARKQG